MFTVDIRQSKFKGYLPFVLKVMWHVLFIAQEHMENEEIMVRKTV